MTAWVRSAVPASFAIVRDGVGPSTLVMKSTWLPGDEARAAPHQLPVGHGIAHPDGLHLYYPTDLVPPKSRLDVVLAGIAGAAVELEIDGWSRRFVAPNATDEESAQLPMVTAEGLAFVRLLPVRATSSRYRERGFQHADASLTLPLRSMPACVRLAGVATPATWAFRHGLRATIEAADGARTTLPLACDTIFVEARTRTLVLVHRVALPDALVHGIEVRRDDDAQAASPPPPFTIQTQAVGDVEPDAFRLQNGWVRPRPTEVGATRAVDPPSPADPLPFVRPIEPRPPSERNADRLTGLPFVRADASVAPRTDPSPWQGFGDAPRFVAPAAPPPPHAPVVAPPAPLAIEDYARVRARIASGEPLGDALVGLGLSDDAYRAADRRIALALAREARTGGSGLATRIASLVGEAARQ